MQIEATLSEKELQSPTHLGTDFGYLCNSFLKTIPPSLTTECPKKGKPVLTRSTYGHSLQAFCPQAACVSFW